MERADDLRRGPPESLPQDYVTSEQPDHADGQVQFITDGKAFDFTRPSVELKADWIQLASCSNPPAGVHVETVTACVMRWEGSI